MIFPLIFAEIRRRPEMYLPAATLDAASSFVMGYDAAVNGGLLWAFREWLIPQLNHGNNLAWPVLVQELIDRRSLDSMTDNRPPAVNNQQAAIENLFAIIETFLRERDQANGTRRIFASYERWINEQEWYDPASPSWIPPTE